MQLRQSRALQGTNIFDLADHLTLRHEALLQSTETTFDLTRIAPTPKRLRHVPLDWIVAASIPGLIAVYGVFNGWLTGPTAGSSIGFFLMAGMSALFCSYAWRSYRDILVFYDRFTNEPAFTIWRTSPTAEEVATFVAAIAQGCTRLRAPIGSSTAESSAFYTRVLQQLLDAGVLLEPEYYAVVKRLEASASTGTVLRLIPDDA